MLTVEQIRQIAALPPEQDFRFKSEYGKTLVIVSLPRGEMQIDEDGKRFYFSPTGMQAFWSEKCEMII